jgi:hypothetical protein
MSESQDTSPTAASRTRLTLYNSRLISPYTEGTDIWYLQCILNDRAYSTLKMVLDLSQSRNQKEHMGFSRIASLLSLEVMGKAHLVGYEKSIELARAWLNDCLHNHKACSRGNQTMLPTRLTRIDDGKLRLCLSAELSEFPKYATLSHCWGKSRILRLLSNNLPLFLRDIRYNDLSKTFRDSIDIARDLGFSFIWIDSLCIVQDDVKDWEREAICMAKIYGMSSLNIAAAAAKDGDGGCLFPREPTQIRPTRVEVEVKQEAEDEYEKRVYVLVESDLVTHEIDLAPLSRRAWALQERVLSPRNLYCAASQFFWECSTRSACETFPDQIPAEFVVHDRHLPKRNLWRSWREIVFIYSASSLTYQKDKPVAITGIARRIHEETGYGYIAGLWRKNFESQLCWIAGVPNTRKRNVHLHELGVTEMPSWSWLASDVRIWVSCSVPLTVKLYIEVVSAVVTLDGAIVLDPFGLFNGGVLTINIKYLLSCKVQRIQHLPEESREKCIFFAYAQLVASVYWDYEDCHDPCMLLPVGQFGPYDEQGEIIQECILLRPTGGKKGQYERVGAMSGSLCPGVYTNTLDDLLRGFETPDHSSSSKFVLAEQDYQSVKSEDGVDWYTITII